MIDGVNSYDVEITVPNYDPRLVTLTGEPRARVTLFDMVFDAYIVGVDHTQFSNCSETRISLACTGAPIVRRPAVADYSKGSTYVQRMRDKRKKGRRTA